MKTNTQYDVIVAGSGMDVTSAAAMLASDGYKVLVSEAPHAPEGAAHYSIERVTGSSLSYYLNRV